MENTWKLSGSALLEYHTDYFTLSNCDWWRYNEQEDTL